MIDYAGWTCAVGVMCFPNEATAREYQLRGFVVLCRETEGAEWQPLECLSPSPSATTPDEPASRPADAKGQGNAT